MRSKAKRGSSLISLLVIMSILIIVATSMLSLILGDFKARVNESARLKNLYETESGLDEALAVLGSIVDSSIDKGNEAVEAALPDLSEEEKKSNKLIIKQNEIFQSAYQKELKLKIIDIRNNNDGLMPISRDKDAPEVNIITETENIHFNDQGNLIIKLQSKFITKNNQSEINDRIITADYKLSTPKYSHPYSYESMKVNLPVKSIWTKALYAEGNINIYGNTEVNGDIYTRGAVSGEEKGLILGNSAALNTRGEIITVQDTILKDNKSSLYMINGNSNLYTGSLSLIASANNSLVNIKGQVFANNDLVLNSSRSTINVDKGYFGFNDVTDKSTIEDKSKNSSAIIINSPDIGLKEGSSINIKGEAMFLGTAYIKSNPEYQTGESVAVKGNYRAYSKGLTNDQDVGIDSLNEDNVIFDYISPLQLVARFKNGNQRELIAKEKSEYFILYSQLEENRAALKLEGISLPENTVSTGIIITKGIDGKPVIKGHNYSPGVGVNRKDEYTAKINSIKNFSQEINLSKLTRVSNIKDSDEGTEIIYIHKDNTPLRIEAGYGGGSSDNKLTIKNGKGTGIIIAPGDIVISNGIEISGTIIAGGSITVEGNAKVALQYNSEYVKRRIAENPQIFGELFTGTAFDYQQIEIIKSIDTENLSNNLRSNYISTNNWKIVK
ncbi:hypothetical protein ACPWSR_00670 [Alloiococcus sp. CFN-8]|uniref:type II secretion system protein n=1 Tax=Alloiococcus sp. CFN-8 TaxID=3416081 RepID=UPI003CF67BB1